MVAGAGIIVFSVFANIKNYTDLGANINQVIKESNQNPVGQTNKLNKPLSQKSDIDKDGLFDDEEPIYRSDPLNPDTDGDGFLDGEEVATGCSPISKSLKDCDLKPGVGQANVNLTDYFTSLIVGGFLSKDLDRSNPNLGNYIDALAKEASQIQKVVLTINEPDFEIESSLENHKSAQEYLNSFENILIQHFLKKEVGLNRVNAADFDYSPYLKDAEITFEELSKLKPVPGWTEIHKKTLKFFFELKSYFSNLNNQKEDPIKTILTLKQTEKLISDYEALTKELSEKIRKEGLKTRIFNL